MVALTSDPRRNGSMLSFHNTHLDAEPFLGRIPCVDNQLQAMIAKLNTRPKTTALTAK